MPSQGKFRKTLSLTDLTFIGLGSIFGSGWLFAASHVASMAGPAGIVSWIFGGIAVFLLGLVYCELGAALPRAGGVVRYPEYSHGPLLGSLMGFITLIAFSSLIAIEAVASRQYAAAWFPSLTQADGTSPSLLGWIVQFGLLVLYFLLNYFSIKSFAISNNIVSIFKFMVPVLVIVLLLSHFDGDNMQVHGFAPNGMAGIQAAISTGGIIFAYLGLTPIVSVASEVRDPQRTIPFALILSIVLSTVIYVLLQLSFLGSIPGEQLAGGWSGIDKLYSLPYRDIAVVLGLGWLAWLVVADAVVSPSGTGNIYMSATPRVIYGWARGLGIKTLTKVDAKSGIPRPALWLSFALSVFWTLPFPSWEKLIGVVSAALMLSYAAAPVAVASLRRSVPGLPRPFRVRALVVLGPLSFIVAALIVYWSRWQTLSWLLGLQVVMFAGYVLYRLPSPAGRAKLVRQVQCSAWLIVFYVLVMLVSYLGSFGGIGAITHPWDTALVAVIAYGIYEWAARAGLRHDELALEEDDGA